MKESKTAAPMMRLSDIQLRLSPLSINEVGLAALGFCPDGRVGDVPLFREEKWVDICAAIAAHVSISACERFAE